MITGLWGASKRVHSEASSLTQGEQSIGLRSVRLRRRPSRNGRFLATNEPTRPYTVSSAAPYGRIPFTDGDTVVSTGGGWPLWWLSIQSPDWSTVQLQCWKVMLAFSATKFTCLHQYSNTVERVQVTQFGNFVMNIYLRQFAGSEHCLYFEVKEVAHCYM
jgi:hypothetical protein